LDAGNFLEALQLAISPVILISAYGLLLLSMTNRLGRAIDRARQLVKEDAPGNEEQIAIIARRAIWIRRSIVFICLALLAAALLVLVLFSSLLLPPRSRTNVRLSRSPARNEAAATDENRPIKYTLAAVP
jgi:hypothetical protein